MRVTRTRTALAALSLLAVVAAACSSSGTDAGSAGPSTTATAAASTTTSPATTAATTTAPPTTVPTPRYYLSLGDSYASGFQPKVGNTRDGFAYQVAAASQTSPHPLQLVNVGCAGATTASLLGTKGCPPGLLGPDATPYPDQTQLEAAEAFLQAHPGQVALITVSIGGNDVTPCGTNPDVATCVGTAMQSINTNLPVIAQRLRAAAGPQTLIVGTTYPDVILGEWVGGAANGQQLATLSVGAFQALINPALAQAYQAVGGQFADVTAATGAYGPLTELTTLAPYGSIPVPVAKVCELTYYCSQHDIHPNQAGYKVIADLVLSTYLKAQPPTN